MFRNGISTVALLLAILFGLGGSSLNAATTLNTMELVALQNDVKSEKAEEKSEVRLTAYTSPDRLYNYVWSLINEDFYDHTFNHQDWKRWQHKYDGKLSDFDASHKAIETMLASLGDRYTRFLDKDAFDDEKNQIDAQLCGIGVQIGLDKQHRVVVISPIEDTPAQKAGIRPADLILEIDGKATTGFSVDDAAKYIRGEVDSKVNLLVGRGTQKKKFLITRKKIPLKSVQTSKMLDSKVGYIRLSSFISHKVDIEMIAALKELTQAKALILDLRDNPGGLLNKSISVSDLFLDSGNIVSTVDKEGYKTSVASKGRPICRLPMVVLINKGSASASEITMGALKDNGRAILIGEKSFGKGLVQGINKLDDGSGVNITIARYLTPNDSDIHEKGISPDIEVKLTKKQKEEGKGCWWLDPNGTSTNRSPEDFKDLQLKKAYEVVKESLNNKSSVAMHPALP